MLKLLSQTPSTIKLKDSEPNKILNSLKEYMSSPESEFSTIDISDMNMIDACRISVLVSTEHFIICQGTSTMQVSAIADSVREYVQEKSGVKPFNYDGYRNSQWIVIDYGTIYVHVFLPEYREYYNLEQLWNDAEIKEIPDID